MTNYPNWLRSIVEIGAVVETDEKRMDIANAIALENVSNSGGPFGAIICDEDGKVISCGFNAVTQMCDSTAHAEVIAIRNAQSELGVFNLSDAGSLTLYTSCAPCIMCFGAIWWSGLSRVVSSALAKDAEAVGFKEGPVTAQMWEDLKREKAVEHLANFQRNAESLRAFKEFEKTGKIY